MKKLILFSKISFLLLSLSYLNAMDRPHAKDERLHKFAMDYIKNYSFDIRKIEIFIDHQKIDVGQDSDLLHTAITYGCLPLVKLVIMHGADLSQALPNGDTPLQMAFNKAKRQDNTADIMRIRMGEKKPEYKKVFLYLLKCLLKQNIPVSQLMLDFALPLANEYNDRELQDILQGLKTT